MNPDFQKLNSFIHCCKRSLIFLILVAIVFVPLFSSVVAAEKKIFRAVIFHKNSCQNDCRTLLDSILPSYKKKYDDQVSILVVNNSTSTGGYLYLNTILEMEIPSTHKFPLMIFGDHFLDGAEMITVSLPKVLKDSIEKNGISWPSITGLKEAQTEADKNERVDGNIWIKAGSSNWMAILLLEFRAKFNQDPEGNLLAVVLLISMTFSVFGVVLVFSRTPSTKLIIPPMWIISLLSVIGLAIAAYFIYIGITGTEIVCGPVGDCHTVQQSSFAYLFGIIPVSIPGFLSYLIILMSCFIKRSVSGDLRDYLAILIWGISFWGVLFFIYLTFLEPFVIGASCAWCMSAATVMTLIMIAATNPARISWWKLRK